MIKKYNIIIQNNIQELTKLSKVLEGICIDNHLSEKLCFDINLVMDEIVTNIISYGYDDVNVHFIRNEIVIDDSSIDIEIIDDGIEFNPLEATKPNLEVSLEERKIGGLGIYLVRSLMDKVEYKRINGNNVLKLNKLITK